MTLMNNYSNEKERTAHREADIEYFIIDDKITYNVNLGNLVFHDSQSIVQDRYLAMEIMALFLIEKQEAFLRSPDMRTAYENIKSLEQKDYLDFYNKNNPSQKFKDKSWASRIISGKLVQAPFSRSFRPLEDFFDSLWEKIVILKKAIDIHLSFAVPGINPLTATDQSNILSEKEHIYSARKVSETLWPKLRKLYPQEEWKNIRLEGGQGITANADSTYIKRIVDCIKSVK